jgi:soluble lytic murein transglycosylase-like protein
MSWLAAELPPTIPPACVERAASYYDVPLPLLVSVLHQEAGEVGKAYERPTGTYYGPGQISDKWVARFSQWGYNAQQLKDNPCANVTASAYVLAYYKIRETSWSNAIARYNVGSLDTPERQSAGIRYANKVIRRWWDLYNKWVAGK